MRKDVGEDVVGNTTHELRLQGIQRLSGAVALIEASRAQCLEDLDVLVQGKDESEPKGLPVARRRDGWSFLLADAEDMQRLNRITLDGETVLVQIAGELVDAAALAWAYDCANVYAPKAIAAFEYLSRVARSDQQGAAAFELMGLSSDVYNLISSTNGCDDSRF